MTWANPTNTFIIYRRFNQFFDLQVRSCSGKVRIFAIRLQCKLLDRFAETPAEPNGDTQTRQIPFLHGKNQKIIWTLRYRIHSKEKYFSVEVKYDKSHLNARKVCRNTVRYSSFYSNHHWDGHRSRIWYPFPSASLDQRLYWNFSIHRLQMYENQWKLRLRRKNQSIKLHWLSVDQHS